MDSLYLPIQPSLTCSCHPWGHRMDVCLHPQVCISGRKKWNNKGQNVHTNISAFPLPTLPYILRSLLGSLNQKFPLFSQWPELGQTITSIKEFSNICLTFLPNQGSVDRNENRYWVETSRLSQMTMMIIMIVVIITVTTDWTYAICQVCEFYRFCFVLPLLQSKELSTMLAPI